MAGSMQERNMNQVWRCMPAIPAPGREHEKKKNQGETSSLPTVTKSTVTNYIGLFFFFASETQLWIQEYTLPSQERTGRHILASELILDSFGFWEVWLKIGFWWSGVGW